MTQPDDPTPVEGADAEGTEALRARVKDTNIDERTLLATDYLNHFNEIVMLLELIPDMPDCLEDAKEWAPKSYADHFRDSGFVDGELAVAAYAHVEPKYLQPFEDTIGRMNRLVALSVSRIEAALAIGEAERVKHVTQTATQALQKLIDVASAIIHGSEIALGQDEIDDLFPD